MLLIHSSVAAVISVVETEPVFFLVPTVKDESQNISCDSLQFLVEVKSLKIDYSGDSSRFFVIGSYVCYRRI